MRTSTLEHDLPFIYASAEHSAEASSSMVLGSKTSRAWKSGHRGPTTDWAENGPEHPTSPAMGLP